VPKETRSNLGRLSRDGSGQGLWCNVDEMNLGKGAREAVEVHVIARSRAENAESSTVIAARVDEGIGEASAVRRVKGPIVVTVDHARHSTLERA
jgi:hypothetical protein